jgi:hypothetical protein
VTLVALLGAIDSVSMAEKRAPAPLPDPSNVPQVSVASSISLGALRGISKVFSNRHDAENNGAGKEQQTAAQGQ